jgi:uracil-DNA glycosylase
VMLLNRVLTVEPGQAASHRKKGWEAVTEQAIRALVARAETPDAPGLVAVLWGRDAATLKPMLGSVPCIESAHPSPLSASRGFFGSKPFTRVNELLVEGGDEPIDWTLP